MKLKLQNLERMRARTTAEKQRVQYDGTFQPAGVLRTHESSEVIAQQRAAA